jgi:hypothetical protein
VGAFRRPDWWLSALVPIMQENHFSNLSLLGYQVPVLS